MHFDEQNKVLEGVTVAKKSKADMTLEEMTYDRREILVTRRKFQMDTKGRIRNGLVFDGDNNLLGRTEYGFDEWDRIKQERLYTKKGKLVRAVLYRYDAGGNPIKPIAYTFDPSNPSSKRRVAKDIEPLLPASRNESDYPGMKLTTPDMGNRAPSNANLNGLGRGGTQTADKPKPTPKPKRKSFFRRLFGE